MTIRVWHFHPARDLLLLAGAVLFYIATKEPKR